MRAHESDYAHVRFGKLTSALNLVLTLISYTCHVQKRVLFVCVHNAGRSQMAEAFVNHFATKYNLDVVGESAGTVGGNRRHFSH